MIRFKKLMQKILISVLFVGLFENVRETWLIFVYVSLKFRSPAWCCWLSKPQDAAEHQERSIKMIKKLNKLKALKAKCDTGSPFTIYYHATNKNDKKAVIKTFVAPKQTNFKIGGWRFHLKRKKSESCEFLPHLFLNF